MALADADTPGEFWTECAHAMMIGSMPSHARYALNKATLKGMDNEMFRILDTTSRRKLREPDIDSAYDNKALWDMTSAKDDSMVTLLSRPLGVRMTVKGDWRLQLVPYNKHLSIAGETLDAFARRLIKGNPVRDSLPAFLHGNGIAYVLRDPNIYADRGGAHMHFIALERDAPAFPGLALENQPRDLSRSAGRHYYVAGYTRSRFPGKLYYLYILDTCEDIYAVSWKTFSSDAGNQIVIE